MCVHEAGHLVAACAFHWPILWAEITPEGGEVRSKGPRLEGLTRGQRFAQRSVSAISGCMAEAILSGEDWSEIMASHRSSGGKGLVDSDNLAEALGMAGQVVADPQMLMLAAEKSEAMLRVNWELVRTFAALLDQRSYLPGREVWQIVESLRR